MAAFRTRTHQTIRLLGLEKQYAPICTLALDTKTRWQGKIEQTRRRPSGLSRLCSDLAQPRNEYSYARFSPQGFSPQAVINFLALLGWNNGTEQEIFSLDELVAQFDITRVNKAGAKFDYEKAKWMNQQHIKAMPIEQLTAQLTAIAPEEYRHLSHEALSPAVALMRDRLILIGDFWRDAGSCSAHPPNTMPPLYKKNSRPN